LDTVIESLENRFSKHKEMYVEFEWLHPINFKLISNLPENAMNKLAELLTDFFPKINKKNITRTINRFCRKMGFTFKNIT